jgi:hypothetical protein
LAKPTFRRLVQWKVVGYDKTNQLETIIVEDDWLDQPAGDYYSEGWLAIPSSLRLVVEDVLRETGIMEDDWLATS